MLLHTRESSYSGGMQATITAFSCVLPKDFSHPKKQVLGSFVLADVCEDTIALEDAEY